MEALPTMNLYPFFNLQKDILRKYCFKRKTEVVNFLFATYNILTAYEIYLNFEICSKMTVGCIQMVV